MLLPLSWDKGTLGQEFFFVPGQRDKGTSRGNTDLNSLTHIQKSYAIQWQLNCLAYHKVLVSSASKDFQTAYFDPKLNSKRVYYSQLSCSSSMIDYPETHQKPPETGRSGFRQAAGVFINKKKGPNSCSQMWLIDQLCIKLGIVNLLCKNLLSSNLKVEA